MTSFMMGFLLVIPSSYSRRRAVPVRYPILIARQEFTIGQPARGSPIVAGSAPPPAPARPDPPMIETLELTAIPPQ
ncbi:hypothetical protein, partial [Achromobacter xylosoxidans]